MYYLTRNTLTASTISSLLVLCFWGIIGKLPPNPAAHRFAADIIISFCLPMMWAVISKYANTYDGPDVDMKNEALYKWAVRSLVWALILGIFVGVVALIAGALSKSWIVLASVALLLWLVLGGLKRTVQNNCVFVGTMLLTEMSALGLYIWTHMVFGLASIVAGIVTMCMVIYQRDHHPTTQ